MKILIRGIASIAICKGKMSDIYDRIRMISVLFIRIANKIENLGHLKVYNRWIEIKY